MATPSSLRRSLLKAALVAPALPLLNACKNDSTTSNNLLPGEPAPTPTPPPGQLIIQPELPPNIGVRGSHNPRGMHASLLNDSHKSRGIAWFTDQNDGQDAPAAIVQWSHIDPNWSEADTLNIVDHPFSNIVFADSTPTTGVNAQTHKASLARAAVRRAAGLIDFIVVFQHYTVWTDQAGRGPGNPSLILVQDQMMARYGVDLVLCGHDHVYQRSAPMVYGKRTPLGYVQVMVGTGGQSIRDFDDSIQSWSEKEFKGLGFCRYEVSPGLIKVSYFGSKGIDTPETPGGVGSQVIEAMDVDEDFELIDSFEVRPRQPSLANTFIKPARSATELARAYNWDAIIAHTSHRNKHHVY